jgi:hypothetical protein
MRTRSANEDLVVVDLDDPDEVASRGPGAQRRHFEDHYAELPFGLGTVPRRLEPDPWYTRPGVLLWIVIALLGLLALAGRDDATTPSDDRSLSATVPILDAVASSRLAFLHVSSWFVLDVDRRSFASADDPGPWGLNISALLRAEPTQFEGRAGPLVVQEVGGDTVIAENDDTVRPIAASVAPSDDAVAIVEYGRWLFAAVDTRLVAIEIGSREAGRVESTLPPYELMVTS